MTARRKLPPDTDLAAFLRLLPPEARRAAIETLGPEDREALDLAWEQWAHAGQLAPQCTANGGPWSTWVIRAGRGFGKTLAGSQWLTRLVAGGERLRIALVGATIDEARAVMVEGESGLLNVAGPWVAEWSPTRRRLRFRTGAEATLFSGHSPDMLRGPQHHYAWCDELAKWKNGRETWDMLWLGLRKGDWPQAVVTTTPRSGQVLRAIMAEPGTVVTGGPTRANPHLSAAWRERIEALYEGTRLGRQELDGELLPDAAGALWTVELIERCRFLLGTVPNKKGTVPNKKAGLGDGRFGRTLIAVDPPVGDGTCGIVACARDADGIAHILADHSVTARSPEGWARAVAAAAMAHETSEVVAEANQGGKMVKAVLSAADPGLRVKLVHASTGKSHRAEPVAHLFEAGRVRLHGRMPELEAELLGMIAGGGYEGPGTSPDRADAMVWGVGELMGVKAEPRLWVG